MNAGVVRALEKKLGCDVLVPEQPLLSGALGAALLGKEHVARQLTANETIVKKERRLTEATFFGNG
jgi:hypothetical protein